MMVDSTETTPSLRIAVWQELPPEENRLFIQALIGHGHQLVTENPLVIIAQLTADTINHASSIFRAFQGGFVYLISQERNESLVLQANAAGLRAIDGIGVEADRYDDVLAHIELDIQKMLTITWH